jgi:predicted acyl esterase
MYKSVFGRLTAIALLLCFTASAWAVAFDKSYKRIPGWDGTELGALVLVPKGQGQGPFPLVVMPASWAMPNLEYLGRATVLASHGYVVVSYTSRGFWDSAGKIDIAGAPTIEDASAVIDWALANTPANPDAIGISGISYGAGTSLLAAARDPRIKAVAALSGWADLQASLYANNTVSKQGVAMLVAAGTLTGRAGPELAAITSRVAKGDYDGAVEGFLPQAASRGAVNEVEQINQNGAAILLANSFNDGLFPPNQYVDFYQKLTVPKRLMLSQGDHATVELPGALGLPSTVYDTMERWFDHYLKGAANGVPEENSVRVKAIDGEWLEYPNWEATQTGTTVYGLSKPRGLLRPTGSLGSADAAGWTYRITTGIPTVANSGVVMISGLLQSLGLPATASIPLVARTGAGVWSGPVYSSERTLVGAPELQLTVTPSQKNVSVVAYLYDVNALGYGTLLSHKPYSLRNAEPGLPYTLAFAMETTASKIKAGHHLVLVVDTIDPRYQEATSFGGSLTFSSPSKAPSRLRVPLR